MKIIALLLTAFFCISANNPQKKSVENLKSNTIEKIINSQWTFSYFPDETADTGYESPGFNDSKWPAISLPHTWNTYETTGELHSAFTHLSEGDNPYWWTGWGWYRKHFSIVKGNSDKKVFIEFKGIRKYCKIWLNGKLLGEQKGDNGSFSFDISGSLKPGEDNVLAVAVNNLKNDPKMPGPAGDNFNFYGGIYGDVKLVLKDKLYFPLIATADPKGGSIITTPQWSEKEGIVKIITWVKNDLPQKKNCVLQTSVSDATGNIVQVIKSEASIDPGQLYEFEQTSKSIKNPHLWSPQNPYYYRIISFLLDGKEITDSFSPDQGLRFPMSDDSSKVFSAGSSMNLIEEVFLKNMNPDTAITNNGTMQRAAAKILLSVADNQIVADRGTVSVITADIVDLDGNPVPHANNTLRWKVSGPATLVGPAFYESDITKHHQARGIWYFCAPVSNIIRSTGKPGKIRITVSASGLASGSTDLLAEETKIDNSVFPEPILADEGRTPAARIAIKPAKIDEVPNEIKLTNDDFNAGSSDKSGFERMITGYILKNNPAVDSVSVEFKTLVDLFVSQLLNNRGNLPAEDYNFNVDNYNTCRLISGYINSTKLPQPFKDGLRRYYAEAIIRHGSEKDTGEEMNWLNWIPSGGTVVIVRSEVTNTDPKGVIVANSNDLNDIISAVYPKFVNFSKEAKERALIFISKMNPYVHVTSINEQASVSSSQKPVNNLYKAEKGVPVLIPLLKFIAE